MENPTKMNDLGVPLFLETPIWNHTGLHIQQTDALNDKTLVHMESTPITFFITFQQRTTLHIIHRAVW